MRPADSKQDWVVFHATQPDVLAGRTADLTNALRNLPVLREESLDRFRRNVSNSNMSCKTVSLAEAPEFLFGLIVYESWHRSTVPGVSRLEVECTYAVSFHWGEKKALSVPLYRYFRDGRADFFPHIVGRVDDDQFEVWHVPERYCP